MPLPSAADSVNDPPAGQRTSPSSFVAHAEEVWGHSLVKRIMGRDGCRVFRAVFPHEKVALRDTGHI
jgi:hypothetical protein